MAKGARNKMRSEIYYYKKRSKNYPKNGRKMIQKRSKKWSKNDQNNGRKTMEKYLEFQNSKICARNKMQSKKWPKKWSKNGRKNDRNNFPKKLPNFTIEQQQKS